MKSTLIKIDKMPSFVNARMVWISDRVSSTLSTSIHVSSTDIEPGKVSGAAVFAP